MSRFWDFLPLLVILGIVVLFHCCIFVKQKTKNRQSFGSKLLHTVACGIILFFSLMMVTWFILSILPLLGIRFPSSLPLVEPLTMTETLLLIGTWVLLIWLPISWVVAVYYDFKIPTAPRENQTEFCWLPKHRIFIEFPPEIIDNLEATTNLFAAFADWNFREVQKAPEFINFCDPRDLETPKVKNEMVEVTIPLPLEPRTKIQISYQEGRLYDRGLLWQFAKTVKAKLEAEITKQILESNSP